MSVKTSNKISQNKGLWEPTEDINIPHEDCEPKLTVKKLRSELYHEFYNRYGEQLQIPFRRGVSYSTMAAINKLGASNIPDETTSILFAHLVLRQAQQQELQQQPQHQQQQQPQQQHNILLRANSYPYTTIGSQSIVVDPASDNSIQSGHRKLERTQSDPTEQPRYKTELCRPYEETGECRYAEKCQFAHGVEDLRDIQRHPKYKTELCRTYHQKGVCPYGPRCHFIHNYSESLVGKRQFDALTDQHQRNPDIKPIGPPSHATSSSPCSSPSTPSSSFGRASPSRNLTEYFYCQSKLLQPKIEREPVPQSMYQYAYTLNSLNGNDNIGSSMESFSSYDPLMPSNINETHLFGDRALSTSPSTTSKYSPHVEGNSYERSSSFGTLEDIPNDTLVDASTMCQKQSPLPTESLTEICLDVHSFYDDFNEPEPQISYSTLVNMVDAVEAANNAARAANNAAKAAAKAAAESLKSIVKDES